MTQNQIESYMAQETARHNEVVENETTRHNKATEDIEKDRNYIEETYKSETNRLSREYNTAYLAYLNAAKEDKYELETKANDIKDLMAYNDEWYKREMASIEDRLAASKEKYESNTAYTNAYLASLQAKRDYYTNQKTAAETNNIFMQWEFSRDKLRNEKLKIQNDYALGLISAEQRDRELELAQSKFDEDVRRFNGYYGPNVSSDTQQNIQSTEESKERAKTEKTKRANLTSQTVRNYSGIGSDIIDSIMPF